MPCGCSKYKSKPVKRAKRKSPRRRKSVSFRVFRKRPVGKSPKKRAIPQTRNTPGIRTSPPRRDTWRDAGDFSDRSLGLLPEYTSIRSDVSEQLPRIRQYVDAQGRPYIILNDGSRRYL